MNIIKAINIFYKFASHWTKFDPCKYCSKPAPLYSDVCDKCSNEIFEAKMMGRPHPFEKVDSSKSIKQIIEDLCNKFGDSVEELQKKIFSYIYKKSTDGLTKEFDIIFAEYNITDNICDILQQIIDKTQDSQIQENLKKVLSQIESHRYNCRRCIEDYNIFNN